MLRAGPEVSSVETQSNSCVRIGGFWAQRSHQELIPQEAQLTERVTDSVTDNTGLVRLGSLATPSSFNLNVLLAVVCAQ